MIEIDWINFTPFSSFFGGLLVGLAAILLMLTNGRIAGVSGLLGKLLISKDKNQLYWIIVFFVGLMIGPIIYAAIFGAIKSNIPVLPAIL